MTSSARLRPTRLGIPGIHTVRNADVTCIFPVPLTPPLPSVPSRCFYGQQLGRLDSRRAYEPTRTNNEVVTGAGAEKRGGASSEWRADCAETDVAQIGASRHEPPACA